MLVYKCGIEIITKLNAIHAIITGISIRFDRVIYEISYFKDAIYYQIWLHEEEFTLINDSEKIKIGFKK